ncbi:unnamed protein product [Owenia fusiformis]|uniref:Uncharacterized protein n=1 Tax=Owenia fusiformis TaxID=6347 RepID=A0A8J1XSL2_OWEFU|nr:unnamed protein product [Owenia fusiformis]
MATNEMMTFLMATGLIHVIYVVSLSHAAHTPAVPASSSTSNSPSTHGRNKWLTWNHRGVRITLSTSSTERPATITASMSGHLHPTKSQPNYDATMVSISPSRNTWQHIRPTWRPSTTHAYGYHPNRRYRIRSRDRYLLAGWHVVHTTLSPGANNVPRLRTAALKGATSDDLGAAAIIGLTVICLTVLTMVAIGGFLIYRRVSVLNLPHTSLHEDDMTEAMVAMPTVSPPPIEPKADDTPPSQKVSTASYEVPCEVNTREIEHEENQRAAVQEYSTLVAGQTGDLSANINISASPGNDDEVYEEIAEYIQSP